MLNSNVACVFSMGSTINSRHIGRNDKMTHQNIFNRSNQYEIIIVAQRWLFIGKLTELHAKDCMK